MPRKKVAIPPSPRLQDIIGATSFTVADAVSEIVANSLDARSDEQPMTIQVEVEPDHVSVIDDGVGMSEEVLVQAIRLGVDMDAVVGDRVRKGAFGLGMKTACASLGRWWTIITRPENSDRELRVEFDLDEWVSR